jgi:hypothetical protein
VICDTVNGNSVTASAEARDTNLLIGPEKLDQPKAETKPITASATNGTHIWRFIKASSLID